MRRIYLLRHGQLELPPGGSRCISRSDLSLSLLGRLQAVLLGRHFSGLPIAAVYHTGLQRTRETAEQIAGTSLPCRWLPGLEELGVGLWEGLPFARIREMWPDEYRRRGENPGADIIPGGEAPAQAQKRAKAALLRLLEQTQGDLVVVAHAGVNRLLLTELLGLPLREFLRIPQPYAAVNVLEYAQGMLQVAEYGKAPCPPLDAPLCAALLQAAGCPPAVQEHCRAVAEKALELAARSSQALDLEVLQAACLLHDILRTQADHARAGAGLLEELGYPRVAQAIAGHHDLPPGEEQQVTEGSLLYLSDKLVQGSREVSLQERFAASAGKCVTAEARAAHQRRLEQAETLENLLRAKGQEEKQSES